MTRAAFKMLRFVKLGVIVVYKADYTVPEIKKLHPKVSSAVYRS